MVVVLSDDEDSAPMAHQQQQKKQKQQPVPGSGLVDDTINVVSESEDDDDSFIASEDDESGSEDDESRSSESSMGSEDEAEATDSDESMEDEATEPPLDSNITAEEMDRQYRNGERQQEPPGYMDLPQLHAPFPNDPDSLWRSIKQTTQRGGFVKKYGIQASERTINGKKERIVHRVDYGTKYEHRRDYPTGSYNDVLVPLMEMLFQQQPYIAPPDFNRANIYAKPQFLDFIAAFHADAREEDGEDLCSTCGPDEDDDDIEDHGPLWCLCTQCTNKGLDNITIMLHKPSGIYLAVGGSCANKLVGYEDLKEMHNIQLNEQFHNDIVSRMLGLRI